MIRILPFTYPDESVIALSNGAPILKRSVPYLGDERLTGTKYAWLRHPANFSEDAWREFRALRESDLKTARAWALKETAMRLFDYRRESAARAFFEQWRGWASRSRLTPMVTVARMLTARLENILTYLKHRITNAVSEGLNSRQCCPGKVAPSDGKSRPFNVLWPVLPGNDLKSRGRKWSPERSIRTRHNEG